MKGPKTKPLTPQEELINTSSKPKIVERNGKKTMILRKIKQSNRKENKAGRKKINSNIFATFNGSKFNSTKATEKERISEFLKAKDKIKELIYGNKDPAKYVKDINELAKNLLTEDQIEAAKGLKLAKQVSTNYMGFLTILDIELNKIEDEILKGKLVNDENMKESEFNKALETYKTLILAKKEDEKNDEEDEEMRDPDLVKKKEECENAKATLLDDAKYEELLKFVDEESKKEGNEGNKEDDINSEDKNIMDKYIDELVKEDQDKIDKEEFNRLLNKIQNGEIKIEPPEKQDQFLKYENDIKIRNSSLKEVDDSIFWIEKRTQRYKDEYLKDFQESDYQSMINPTSSVELTTCYEQMMPYIVKKYNKKEDLFLIHILRNAIQEITLLKYSFKYLTKFLTANEEVKKTEINLPNNQRMIKKVQKGNYISQAEIQKMDKVNKALRNIRDFVQMPKFKDWKGFNDEEKNTFFKERVKYNISRMKFLINISKGIKDESYPDYKTLELGRCLNNQLYYMDKFDSGYKIQKDEWAKLYKKLDNDTRKEIANLRITCRAILEKLEKDNKITGFVKYKGMLCGTMGLAFFNVPFEDLFSAEKERVNNRLLKNAGLGPYKKPTAKKKFFPKFLGRKKKPDGPPVPKEEKNFS